MDAMSRATQRREADPVGGGGRRMVRARSRRRCRELWGAMARDPRQGRRVSHRRWREANKWGPTPVSGGAPYCQIHGGHNAYTFRIGCRGLTHVGTRCRVHRGSLGCTRVCIGCRVCRRASSRLWVAGVASHSRTYLAIQIKAGE